VFSCWSKACPVIRVISGREKPSDYSSPLALGHGINLGCIIMLWFCPGFEQEAHFLRYFQKVILKSCVNEK